MGLTYFFSRISNQNKPWFRNDKPWLVIGKGPTFNKIGTLNLKDYYVFGLNHVCEYIRCDISHCIDIEVLTEEFVDNSDNILIPWHPHRKNRVMRDDLNQLVGHYDNLYDALNKGNLFYYNSSTYKGDINFGKEIVRVKYFSGEVPFQLLGMCGGVKEVFSIGLDGGFDYAFEFRHLHPLSNGRYSFNDQFSMIRRSCDKFGIKWVKL